MVASEVTSVPKNTQKPPNFKRLLVPKRAHLHWAQDQGAIWARPIKKQHISKRVVINGYG